MNSINEKQRITSQNGFALVIVIVVMLLATFLASQLILLVRTELKIAYNIRMRASGRFLAEAGINLGLFRIMDKPVNIDDEEYDIFLEGFMYETALEEGKVQYYAVNESGKIDLNRFQPQLMKLFLEYHQVEEEQVMVIMDSLQDWIDQDDFHRLQGAEKNDYEELDPPYIPRNKPIAEPAEFFLINGTEVLADKFDPADVFTVHNRTRKINFNSLTPLMLDFLVEGDEDKKTAYFESQDLYLKLNAGNALEILGNERFNLVRTYLSYTSGKIRYYSIVSVGKKDYDAGDETFSQSIPGTKVSALVNVTRTRYQFLSWQEDQT